MAVAAHHAEIRLALVSLLRERGPEAVADLPVPACPGWTVKDAVAHLAGVAADILAGNLEGVATDAWTGAQVATRRDTPLAAILDEWDETDPQVEAIADGFGSVGSQWLMDCLTHDVDIRGAVGAPLGPSADEGSPALREAVDFATKNYFRTNVAAGNAVARFRVGDRWLTSRDGKYDATATVSSFELLRGLTGRRSLDQLRAWPWDPSPDLVLPGFTWAVFAPRAEPLVEPG